MKKLKILLPLLLSATVLQAKDCVDFHKTTNDSLIYVMSFVISGGIDWHTVEYEEDGDVVNVNILCSQVNQVECYCPYAAMFSIKKDEYQKAVVSLFVRSRIGGTEEDPVFSDFETSGYSHDISLSDVNPPCQPINGINFSKIINDSLVYIAHYMLIGGEGRHYVEYVEDGDFIRANIYHSRVDVAYEFEELQAPVKIKSNAYQKLIVTTFARWPTNGGVTEYIQLDSKEVSPLSISEPLPNGNTVIYPNPIGDTFYVDLQDKETAFLKIYDIQGYLLFDKIMIRSQQDIDVSYLHPGLYFFVIDDINAFKVVKE